MKGFSEFFPAGSSLERGTPCFKIPPGTGHLRGLPVPYGALAPSQFLQKPCRPELELPQETCQPSAARPYRIDTIGPG